MLGERHRQDRFSWPIRVMADIGRLDQVSFLIGNGKIVNDPLQVLAATLRRLLNANENMWPEVLSFKSPGNLNVFQYSA
jgi:hypothetical protein